jgi:hypothetical protein
LTWTYDEIARDWLVGGVIATEPEQVVASFNRCERVFGREWIDKSRGTSVGASPTLRVFTMGTRLASIESVAGSEVLIEKLVNGDPSATAELHAIHLLRSNGQTQIELFPKVEVSGRQREPDFQIRREQTPWVYVEVTQPDVSEAYDKVMVITERLTSTIEEIAKPFDLEVFLRREPIEAEVGLIVDRILLFCRSAESGREELSDGQGFLLLGAPSGPFVVADHGEEVRPRLAKAKFKIEQGIMTRRVVVRVPYSDERAENFLRREAAQLPAAGPGLVMMHMGNAPGGFTSWEPLIRRRFQPTVHTRVGAVCLFSAGNVLTERGSAILSQTKFLMNLHAKNPLPNWIKETLVIAGSEYAAVMAQAASTKT